MPRERNIPVTDIPVLIPCAADKQEGVSSFLTKPTPIRRLSVDELDPGSLKGLLKGLSVNDREHLFGVLDLISALDAKDGLALQKAAERIYRSNTPMHRLMARLAGVPPNMMGTAEYMLTKLAGVKAERNPHGVLSRTVSSGLSKSRLVLWWTGKRFLPALFCPDAETGLYVLVLLAKVRGKALVVCPQCGKPFLRKRSDQNYCSMQHREAHRMARWRASQARGKPRRENKRRQKTASRQPAKRPRARRKKRRR